MKIVWAIITWVTVSMPLMAGGAENIYDEPVSKKIQKLLSEEKWLQAKNSINGLQDDSLREYWLGYWYHSKGNDNYNPLEAVKHFELSAADRYEAQMILVVVLLTSKDIRIADYQKGLTYASKVIPYLNSHANAGRPDILSNLGLIYLYGMGVEKNLDKAFEYYSEAVRLGSKVGMDNYEALKKVGYVENVKLGSE